VGILAAHLNDAGIVVCDDDQILYREPGFALLDEENLKTGSLAYGSARLKPRHVHNRFWSDLTAAPLADSRFQHMSAADLVSTQLEHIWKRVAKPGDELAIAVPAFIGTGNLGLLLGIAAELNIPIVAMVDAAVAATRRHYVHAVPVHIDLGLHTATLTRLLQEGEAQVERTVVVDDCGLLGLHENWLRVIAEAFVQQSRFDPLHTAETEQVLQDRIPAWLDVAAGAETVAMEIEYRGISHRVEIESLQLVAAAAPIYQSLVSNLRALYRAEDTPAIQLSERAGRMPGLAETLKTRVGGEAYLLEAGATARGLIKRCPRHRQSTGLTLRRHLPWDQVPVEVDVSRAAVGGRPTHLLFGDRASLLGDSPLALGSQAAEGERWLDLGQNMPGVSRRHCVLSVDNNQCVVTDYSRYGTFLNGHRIDGSAVLQTGDVIRIGTPGYELRLISAEQHDGA
jgi:hypothetical protein